MQQSFLTVKLCQLEQQQGKLQAGIRITQKENLEKIKRKIDEIEEECKEEDILLEQSSGNVRSKAVSALIDAQLEYDKKIKEITEQILPESIHKKGEYREEKAEAALLYAEFSIDFAMRASKNALYAALNAIALEKDGEKDNE